MVGNERILKNVIPFVLLGGLVVIANSRFFEITEGYGTFNVLDLRDIIGPSTLEMSVLAVIFALGLMSPKILSPSVAFAVLLCGVLVLVSLISLMVNCDHPEVGVRTIVRYVGPWILFVLAFTINWSESDMKRMGYLMVSVFLVNMICGYIQWLGMGYVIDHLQGFVDDSHMFALLMFFGSLYFLTGYWIHQKRWYLALACAPIPAALVASNDKATALFVCTSIAAYAIYRRMRWIQIAQVLVFSLGVLTLAITVVLSLNENLRRDLIGGAERISQVMEFDSVWDFVTSTAQFRGYSNIIEIYGMHPSAWLWGVGPAMYGSLEANPATVFGAMAFAQDEIHLLGSDAFRFASSDVIVFFIEFGFIYTVATSLLFWHGLKITKPIVTSSSPQMVHRRLWLLSYLMLLGGISMLSFREGFSNSTSSWVYFFFWGMVCRSREGMDS